MDGINTIMWIVKSLIDINKDWIIQRLDIHRVEDLYHYFYKATLWMIVDGERRQMIIYDSGQFSFEEEEEI